MWIVEKYKSVIYYLFFGICTTLVNILTYWCFAHLLYLKTMESTVLAWVSAVLFAFVTNRRWVFQSKAGTAREVFSELIVFVMCRLATGVVDIVCMYVFVQQLYFDDMIIKIGANILVIVLNYFASKFLIFKKEK